MELDQVYRLYFRDVELFLRGLTGSESLAEELTQETFFRSMRQLSKRGADHQPDSQQP